MEGRAALSAYKSGVRKRYLCLAGLMSLLLVALCFWRLLQGEWDLPPERVLELLSPFLKYPDTAAPEAVVVRSVRLPRLMASLAGGGLLCVSGIVLQALLGNPLAEPYTLGIASGAALGGAVGILLGWNTTLSAFSGALLALWIVYGIAWRSGGAMNLVLAGIVTNAFLSAGVTFMKAIADDKLGAIVYWLMGSFAGVSVSKALAVWGAALLVLFSSWVYGRQLDAVSLGRERGALLGIDEDRMRLLLLCAASFGTAVAVGAFGIVGFVGLVVPHLLRLGVGGLHRPLLLLGFLGGACLMTLSDGVAQSLDELPVGVVTALIGVPVFCRILVRKGGIRR